MKLTTRQREILAVMVEHKDDEGGELVFSVPGGWWLGDQRIDGRISFFLLRHVLISKDSYSDKNLEIYRANEYAQKSLSSPAWRLRDEIGHEASKQLTQTSRKD